MARRSLVKILTGLLVIALLILPVTVSCAKPGAPQAGNKPYSVSFGRLTDLTGPYAAISPSIDAGLQGYIEYYNKKFGGIDGVPVEVVLTDVKQDAAQSVTAYRRFKERGSLVVSALSSQQTSAIMKLAADDKIPVVTQATNLSLYMPPNDYIWNESVSNPNEAVAALMWFDTKVWDRAKMGKTWKIGFLTEDTSDTKGALPGMYKYCDENGIDIVGTEITPSIQLDYAVNIRKLVDAGANVIFVSQSGANAGIVLKQMSDLGTLAPLEDAIKTMGKVVPFFNDDGFYIASLQAATEAAKYAYGVTPWAAWFEEDKYPGIKVRNDFMKEKYGHVWHSPQEDGDAFNAGWNCSRIIISAIERTVKSAGWGKLTPQAIVDNGLKGLKLPNDMTCDNSYSDYSGDRIAIETVRIARFDPDRGSRAPISDCLTVDKKYYVTKYTPKKPHPGMFIE